MAVKVNRDVSIFSDSLQDGVETFLDVGWTVDRQFHPKFCTQSKERPDYSDMVRVQTKKMDKHTVIIAQSGSGKSFFLGRLIEEIMIKSKARCLILDPNGDFRKINEIDRELWSSNVAFPVAFEITAAGGFRSAENVPETCALLH